MPGFTFSEVYELTSTSGSENVFTQVEVKIVTFVADEEPSITIP